MVVPALFLFVALTSVGLYIPFSLQVTLAQDYLPTRVGTASGITLGLTVSVGGVTSPLLGLLADATSLRIGLVPLVVMPVVSWLMFRTLHDPQPPTELAATRRAKRRRSPPQAVSGGSDGKQPDGTGTGACPRS